MTLRLATGDTVGDRYVVLNVLGEGGMGQVALVRQNVTNKLGAMKLLTTLAPELVERFNREAAAPSRLNHPSFPAVFDFGQHGGSPYIVMDFVDGETPNRAMHRGHAFSLAEIVDIGRQVAEAMTVAHEAGLVHRDIKADNVMLVARGGTLRTYVLDLGIARFAAESGGNLRTRTGTLIGTPVTMSPEQAQGQAVDGRSDVYSLGCVLFFLATGQYPFNADEALQIAMKHVLEKPARVDQLAPWVPAAFADIIDRTLAKDKNERVQSMAELDGLLGSFAGSPIAPPNYMGRLQTPAKPISRQIPVARPVTPLPERPQSPKSDADAKTITPTPFTPQSNSLSSLSGTNGQVVSVTTGAPRASRLVPALLALLILGGGGVGLGLYIRSQPVKLAQIPDAAPPAPQPANPPPPIQSRIRIDVRPLEAHVFENGKDLGDAHIVVGKPNAQTMVSVRADGYETTNLDVRFGETDEARTVELKKLDVVPVPVTTNHKHHGHSEIIDPYKGQKKPVAPPSSNGRDLPEGL